MKKWDAGRICGVYLILMCSLFPLAVSPKGYQNIVETKFAVFCVLTALFLPAVIACAVREKALLRRKWDAVQYLILAYWGWSLLSALCSPWRRTALLGGDRLDGMITITLYCAVFLLLSLYGSAARFPFWLPAAAAGVLCLVAVLQFFDRNPLGLYPGALRWSGREREYNGAFLSLIGNADLTASVLCTGFAFLWPLALRKGRRFLWLPAALCLAVLAASGIRAGLVGAAASVCLCLPALLPVGKKGKRLAWAGIGLLCAAALLTLYFLPLSGPLGELHALLHGQAEDSFGSGRIYIWKNVWRLVPERPLLGGGADTLGERGIAFVKALPNGSVIRRAVDCAHCEPLNILVNQGLPSLLLLTSAWMLILVRSFRNPSPAAPALRSALIAYTAASFFGIGTTANAPFFWILLGMLSAENTKAIDNQRFNVI